jgi:two-component system chemotaxis response regulator CheB
MPRRNIIVIGASAGGITALQTILPAFPWDLAASVFVVIHTTEDSPGLLPEVLNRSSKLPALYAVHNAPILPARIYLAPPGRAHLMLERGRVKLELGPRENRNRPSIDALFRSASYAYGAQVIGVVLSGNLDDGSAGLAAVKRRGGIALVQDPEEAMAPSMPHSAIQNTEIDFVLSSAEIGPKLVELTGSQGVAPVEPITGGAIHTITPSGYHYSCPECAGVLEEIEENSMARFRCRVGHLYSPESLLADQSDAVERALWAAIRNLEEQAEFSERLATNSRNNKRPRLAHRFMEKAECSRENASILRDLLQKAGELVLEHPELETGTD